MLKDITSCSLILTFSATQYNINRLADIAILAYLINYSACFSDSFHVSFNYEVWLFRLTLIPTKLYLRIIFFSFPVFYCFYWGSFSLAPHWWARHRRCTPYCINCTQDETRSSRSRSQNRYSHSHTKRRHSHSHCCSSERPHEPKPEKSTFHIFMF